MKYIKELDSIRTIAVFFVILCHWLVPNHVFTEDRLAMFGAIGVNLFFVLSGFLITGILLEGKNKSENKQVPVKTVFKNFYARRALRIFPIFYLLILLLLIARLSGAGIRLKELAYSATYTINFLFYNERYWSGYTSHFWSLAVEEQFYLLWPITILLFRKEILPYVMIAFALIGIFTQEMDEFGYITTYSCFDAFAFGAIFSWMLYYRKDLIPNFFKVLRVVSVIALVIIAFQFYLNRVIIAPQRTLHSVVALWLVMTIVLNKNNREKHPLMWLLGNKVLISIGRISYGVYLYHLLIPYIGNFIIKKITGKEILINGLASSNPWFLLMNLGILLILSWISWIVIEQPLLGLKKYFTYQPGKKVIAV